MPRSLCGATWQWKIVVPAKSVKGTARCTARAAPARAGAYPTLRGARPGAAETLRSDWVDCARRLTVSTVQWCEHHTGTAQI